MSSSPENIDTTVAAADPAAAPSAAPAAVPPADPADPADPAADPAAPLPPVPNPVAAVPDAADAAGAAGAAADAATDAAAAAATDAAAKAIPGFGAVAGLASMMSSPAQECIPPEDKDKCPDKFIEELGKQLAMSIVEAGIADGIKQHVVNAISTSYQYGEMFEMTSKKGKYHHKGALFLLLTSILF